jgi:Tfp pilus assembly protein PilN
MAQQINLFNPVFLKQRKIFSALAMAQALGAIALGVILLYGYASYRIGVIEKSVAELEARAKEQREQLLRIARDFSPQGRSKLLEEELARAEARLRTSRELLGSLRSGGLGNTSGFSRYLAAFARQALAGVWLTGISVGADESELTVRGRALHADLVPAYLKALRNEPIMRGRQIAELKLAARDETAASAAKVEERAAARGPARSIEFSLLAAKRDAGAKEDSGPGAGPAPRGAGT